MLLEIQKYYEELLQKINLAQEQLKWLYDLIAAQEKKIACLSEGWSIGTYYSLMIDRQNYQVRCSQPHSARLKSC